jgi:hypothetical protein
MSPIWKDLDFPEEMWCNPEFADQSLFVQDAEPLRVEIARRGLVD